MQDNPIHDPEMDSQEREVRNLGSKFPLTRALIILAVLVATFLCAAPGWSDLGDIFATGSGSQVVRIVPSPGGAAIIGASPGSFQVGTAGNPARAVLSSLTLTGTYDVDQSVSGDYALTGNLTVGAAANTTGQLTTNAVVVNTTMNTTGLATLDNCTVNGTLTSALGVFSSTFNVTGLTTLNAITGNTTCNIIGTTTLNALVGNSTINATGTTTLNALVGNTTANITGLFTANNATINATKTLSVLGPLVLGTQTITTNTTITATCSTVLRVTDIPNGQNINVFFDTPPAGVVHYLVDESGTLGNSTSGGNIVVNVTSGTINGLNNVTLTNATQVNSVYDPTTGTNITCFKLHFPTTTSGFVYR